MKNQVPRPQYVSLFSLLSDQAREGIHMLYFCKWIASYSPDTKTSYARTRVELANHLDKYTNGLCSVKGDN